MRFSKLKLIKVLVFSDDHLLMIIGNSNGLDDISANNNTNAWTMCLPREFM